MTTCQQSLSGVITSGSPIAAGTATGTLTASNFTLIGDPMTATEGAANTTGSITLTESATGAQLNLAIIGRVATTLATGAFNSSGVYTITGGTGRFAGASGAGSTTFSGNNNLMTGITTITSFIFSGDIIM